MGIDFTKSKNLKNKPIISNVAEDGPSFGFLNVNDLILEVEKEKIKTIKNFIVKLKKIKPNQIVMIRVLRRGQELNRVIRVTSLEEYKNPKQKQPVRIGIQLDVNKLIIKCVHKKLDAYKKLKKGDKIIEVNNVLVLNKEQYDNEFKKILWGEEVLIKILRLQKTKEIKIKTSSLINHLSRIIEIGIHTKLYKKKFNKVDYVYRFSSANNIIKVGDIISSLITNVIGIKKKIKIKSLDHLYEEIIENFEPSQKIWLEIYRNGRKFVEEIKLINSYDCNQLKKNSILKMFNKPQSDFLIMELENSEDYSISADLIEKIEKMDLQEENESQDDYKKLFISSYVKKEKVSGKDCFVVHYDSFPNTYEFEENSVFLKVYAFDVTDLDQKEYNIYFETDDYIDNPKLDNYLRDNCNVIKTNNFDWSEGSSILVQKKLLDPNEDPPGKIAFPFSVMNFPKAGKRKIAFRSFICKKELKFHENEGRPLDYQMVNYQAEHFKLNEYLDHFDEYDSYPDILAYDATEIDAEYKQAGYLGVNRQKLDTLIIPIGYAIANIKNDPSKSIQLVKDEIAFKGDRSTEGGINQVLNLKKTYDQAQISKIDPQDYLNEIKNYSKIDERYEVINSLLNIATNDKTLSLEENKFLDEAAKKLELNQNKYLEIKKIETASLKFVDFGDKADESIFGISNEMDDKEKCKILRQEYSRWNSQTNNTDKNKRIRAKEMVNLIANLRKQYSC